MPSKASSGNSSITTRSPTTSSLYSGTERSTSLSAQSSRYQVHEIPTTKSPFVYKMGRKHHGYPVNEVPYPIPYDRKTLDYDVVDIEFLRSFRGLSLINYTERPQPKRVLDLGTGAGCWVLHIAQEWRESEIIGFDIAPIQPDLDRLHLDPSIKNRIRWVNGNFLEKLPFEDGYFDHVRCINISKGVPENKWDSLFEELHRVMSSGSAFEMVEENIIFPYIPRVITEKKLSQAPVETVRHDHTFLEQLFYDVFERRFINLQPTKIIENWMNIHFRHVICGPHLPIPTPPPPTFPTMPDGGPIPMGVNLGRRGSLPMEGTRLDTRRGRPFTAGSETTVLERLAEVTVPSGPTSPTQGASFPAPVKAAGKLGFNSRVLAVLFLRAWQWVISCREPMWEEVVHRNKIRAPNRLANLPRSPEEQNMSDRQRFEFLMQRYERDMLNRTAIPYALNGGFAWALPREDPIMNFWGAAYEVEEDLRDLKREMAALHHTPEVGVEPCRQVRTFVGFKGKPF